MSDRDSERTYAGAPSPSEEASFREPAKCRDCDGTGRVSVAPGWDRRCPSCGGRGVVPAEPTVLGGSMEDDSGHLPDPPRPPTDTTPARRRCMTPGCRGLAGDAYPLCRACAADAARALADEEPLPVEEAPPRRAGASAPTVHVTCGEVLVYAPAYAAPVRWPEAEAGRRLLAFDGLLAACEDALAALAYYRSMLAGSGCDAWIDLDTLEPQLRAAVAQAKGGAT